MASASLAGRSGAVGLAAARRSNSRENAVSPPRLRICACSIQFSRAMRPLGAELALEALDVGRRPVRDLRVAGDALRGQRLLDLAHRCRRCAAGCRARPARPAGSARPARATRRACSARRADGHLPGAGAAKAARSDTSGARLQAAAHCAAACRARLGGRWRSRRPRRRRRRSTRAGTDRGRGAAAPRPARSGARSPSSGVGAALGGLAARARAGVVGLAALGQHLRLLDPVLLVDAALEAERLARCARRRRASRPRSARSA